MSAPETLETTTYVIKRLETSRKLSDSYKLSDVKWRLFYNYSEYRLFPKATIFACSVFICGIISLFSRINEDKYKIRMKEVTASLREAERQNGSSYWKGKTKGREETVQEITGGKIAPEVLTTYVDLIVHLEERKKRDESNRIFAENEVKFRKMFSDNNA